jgi:S1-C subfamily serine protease
MRVPSSLTMAFPFLLISATVPREAGLAGSIANLNSQLYEENDVSRFPYTTTLFALAFVTIAPYTTASAQEASCDLRAKAKRYEEVRPRAVDIQVTKEIKVRNRKEVVSGRGSGNIIDVIDGAGIIMTNNHVVEGDKISITVVLSDGTRYAGTVLGARPEVDVAVVRIENFPHYLELPKIVFASRSDLYEGMEVIAVGNPLGMGMGVTSGIITRFIFVGQLGEGEGSSIVPHLRLAQTDAVINPGNSGGGAYAVCKSNDNDPAVFVGVPTLVVRGLAEGFGFALIAKDAERISRCIIKGGCEPGYIGVGGDKYDPTSSEAKMLKEIYGYGDRAGFSVQRIKPESPAVGKLYPTDLVFSVTLPDGESIPLTSLEDLLTLGPWISAGDTLTFHGWRPKMGAPNRPNAGNDFEIAITATKK